MSILSTKRLRLVAREVAAAFGVLSLMLLSMAHQPLGVGGVEAYRLADGRLPVICGPGVLPNGEAERSWECEACRISSGVNVPSSTCQTPEHFSLKTHLIVGSHDEPLVLQYTGRVQMPRAPPVSG